LTCLYSFVRFISQAPQFLVQIGSLVDAFVYAANCRGDWRLVVAGARKGGCYYLSNNTNESDNHKRRCSAKSCGSMPLCWLTYNLAIKASQNWGYFICKLHKSRSW
jgi:hypothetical protein